ncbi:MAG: UDP-N-acetylmuramoyl-L-alanine--D-glutamate ligase [Acidimicrobiales bacterium]
MSGLDRRVLARPLIVGFGLTGQAVAHALVARGHSPTIVDDRPTDEAMEIATEIGALFVGEPSTDELRLLVGNATVGLPAPGLPDHHPFFSIAAAAGLPIWSEFDLASLWDSRPLVGITGTNGKTTVTLLVTDALERSGIHAVAVGNTEVPLVQAIADPTIDVFVVEASSFRLAHSQHFAPSVAAWLNFAPDHLDAHATLDEYLEAKASIFAHLGEAGVAVVNGDDPVVMAHAPAMPTTVVIGQQAGDWRTENGALVGPDGPLLRVDELPRNQPHDLLNAAAVAAIASAAGASPSGIADALTSFTGFEHRVQHVGTWNNVSWYNDSKATVPHATAAAVGGFDSVVLIAGGRNKGLALDSLAALVPPIRAVVATGDAAPEIEAIFAGLVPVRTADSMAAAIAFADELAEDGDAVLLSPSCTSYDWYKNYGQRGQDFMARVRSRFA